VRAPNLHAIFHSKGVATAQGRCRDGRAPAKRAFYSRGAGDAQEMRSLRAVEAENQVAALRIGACRR
jgi:hypothetical protein